MKIIKSVLILCVLGLWFASAPCFAEVVDSSLSFYKLEGSVESDVPYDPSGGKIAHYLALDDGPAQRKQPLMFAQAENSSDTVSDASYSEDPEDFGAQLSDPLEPVNRAIFKFNDKFYFWLLKPIATGYKWIFPEPFRVAISNFFDNVDMPVRTVNCLLQGKFKSAGYEVTRFIINSTVGFAGFFDAARQVEGMPPVQREDFGQTLAVWGFGPGFYINWPILQSSTVRDTIGMVGDIFLDPLFFLSDSLGTTIAVRSVDRVNETSLILGDYEDLIESALDPYVAVKDAYFQFRMRRIREREADE
ncbi:VacJ family lipoprotein [Thermodesulfobacteriota bacterium]